MKGQRIVAASFIFFSLIVLDLLGQLCQMFQNIEENEKENRLHSAEPTLNNTVKVESEYMNIEGNWRLVNDTSIGASKHDTNKNVFIPEELFCMTFLVCCNMLGLSAIMLKKPLLLLPWLVAYAFVFCASYITCFIVIVFKENDQSLYNEAAFYFINGFCINLNWIFIIKTFMIMKKEKKIE